MTMVSERMLRAIEEYHSVLDEAEDLYVVVSESGRAYTVDLREPACTCPDFEHRDVICKHIRRVQLETGAIEPATLEARLTETAADLEDKAAQFEAKATDLSETARRIRRIVDRLHEIMAEEEPA